MRNRYVKKIEICWKLEISKKPVWGQEVWMDRAVSYTGFIYKGGRIILICMKF